MKFYLAAPVIFAVFFLVGVAVPAHAYIDPNATGLLSQILTPLLIAGAASATFLRKRIGSVVSGLSRRLRRRTDAKEA